MNICGIAYSCEMLSGIARCILNLMGWEVSYDLRLKAHIKANSRMILVYPHTSYWDSIIMFLYAFTFLNESERRRLIILMKPQVFTYLPFLSRLGCIPASRLEDRSSGGTERIISTLRNTAHSDNFLFLISPKGTIKKSEWRHGYYYISREFKAPILPVGLDYSDHKIVVGQHIAYDESISYDDMNEKLAEAFAQIVPLNSNYNGTCTKVYSNKHVGVISLERLFQYFFVSLFISCLSEKMYLPFIVCGISLIMRA